VFQPLVRVPIAPYSKEKTTSEAITIAKYKERPKDKTETDNNTY